MSGRRRRWALSRQGDHPVGQRAEYTRELRELAAAARAGRALWTARPPVLIVAGAVLDGRGAADFASELIILGQHELARAAERSGIDLVAASAATDPVDLDGHLALQGYVSALRGAAGEHHALDRLAGGTLTAPPGTARAELIAHEFPGVDIVFVDPVGRVIDTSNVKIASSTEIIVRHFERHPDVRIVYTTSDTAERLERAGWTVVGADQEVPPDGAVVVDMGKDTDWFDTQIRDGLDGVVTESSRALWGFVPWFGLAAVAVRTVRRVTQGAANGRVVRDAAADTLVVAAGSGAAQSAAAVTGSMGVAVPLAIVGAWAAQAALAVRASWTEAADRDRRLRDHLKWT